VLDLLAIVIEKLRVPSAPAEERENAIALEERVAARWDRTVVLRERPRVNLDL